VWVAGPLLVLLGVAVGYFLVVRLDLPPMAMSIPVALTLAIAYTVLRAAGKLAGAWIARRLFPASTPPTARLLLAPGAFGVAFALNVVRALGDEFAVVLTVVVVGTIASSAVAAVADGGEEP